MFTVACLSIMFLAVKSWNFVSLICLLFAATARGFKNCLTGNGMAGSYNLSSGAV